MSDGDQVAPASAAYSNLRLRKLRHNQDPFESASSPGPVSDQQDSPDSLFSKIVLSPLLAVSFILSLLVVSRRDRERRATEHDLASSSRLSWGAWRRWANPEPYQQFVGQSAAHQKSNSVWVVHVKHRAFARMQLDDAWKLHGQLMFLIVLGLLVVITLLYLALRWIWIYWISN